MYKILVSFGTRPEAIKMCPLIVELKKRKKFQVVVCSTGQHKEMLQQVLDIFEIEPDINLAVMKENQQLTTTFTTIFNGFETALKEYSPDLVLLHGDTLTTAACAMACYFTKTEFAHVEAGLRSGNLHSPWPEEGNRRLASIYAQYHFAVTAQNKRNLLRENIPDKNIYVCGNTVIDALISTRERLKNLKIPTSQYLQRVLGLCVNKKVILVTTHRRENFGQGLTNICNALHAIAKDHPNVHIVIPVHLNPIVRNEVNNKLSDLQNVSLIDPLNYFDFVEMMDHSDIILTDSGGIQEEAPSLGKPVLVLRDTTERTEAVDAGTVKLVGTSVDAILSAVKNLLNDETYRETFLKAKNPYGDGTAAIQIANILTQKMQEKE